MKETSGQTAVLIEADPHTLYAYLMDLSRHPEWSSNLSQVTKISDGPIGVGTRFKTSEGPPPVPPLVKLNMMKSFVKGVLSGAKSFSVAEITALEPDRRIAWYAGIPLGDGFFNKAEWEFVLVPQGQGTQVIQHFCYQPQTGTAEQMVGAAGEAGITQAVALNLKRLKQVVEKERKIVTQPT